MVVIVVIVVRYFRMQPGPRGPLGFGFGGAAAIA